MGGGEVGAVDIFFLFWVGLGLVRCGEVGVWGLWREGGDLGGWYGFCGVAETMGQNFVDDKDVVLLGNSYALSGFAFGSVWVRCENNKGEYFNNGETTSMVPMITQRWISCDCFGRKG